MAKLLLLMCAALLAAQTFALLVPSTKPSQSVEPASGDDDDPFSSATIGMPATPGNTPPPQPYNIAQLLQTLVGLAKRLVDDVDRIRPPMPPPFKGHDDNDDSQADNDGPMNAMTSPFGNGLPVLNIIMTRRGGFPGQPNGGGPFSAMKFRGHSGEDDDDDEVPSTTKFEDSNSLDSGKNDDDKKSRHITRPIYSDSDDDEISRPRFGGHQVMRPFGPWMSRYGGGDNKQELVKGHSPWDRREHRTNENDDNDDDDDMHRVPGPTFGGHGGSRQWPGQDDNDENERRPRFPFGPRGGPRRGPWMNDDENDHDNEDDNEDRRPGPHFRQRGDDDSESMMRPPRGDDENDDDMEERRGPGDRGHHGGPGGHGGRGGRGGRRRPPCRKIIKHLLKLLWKKRHHRWGPGGRGGGGPGSSFGAQRSESGNGFASLRGSFHGPPMMLPFFNMGVGKGDEGPSFDNDRDTK